GNAWTRLMLCQCIFQLTGQKPSRKWVQRFTARHPKLEPKRSRPLDPKRARAFNPNTISKFFDLYEKVICDYEIPPENIYNTDEKGIQLGGGKKASRTEHFFTKGDQHRYVLKSDSLLLVTVIETVSATGDLGPPGIIFFFLSHVPSPSILITHSVSQTENGWTDNSVCHHWFTKSFIPWSRSRNLSNKPILWICDGHKSHETDEMLDLAFTNNIIIMCLPPHTTHKMQPLDVGVFGPFQADWVEYCENAAIESDPVTKYNVIRSYMNVRARSVNKSSILAAFRHCGLWPFNKNIFREEDFAPSKRFSTQASVPTGFP
ncbi:hypothetical protein M422DRAFT_131433, partial [Sphaerobolus stellatus SS14]